MSLFPSECDNCGKELSYPLEDKMCSWFNVDGEQWCYDCYY